MLGQQGLEAPVVGGVLLHHNQLAAGKLPQGYFAASDQRVGRAGRQHDGHLRLLPDVPLGGRQRVVDNAHGVDGALLQELGEVHSGIHQQLHPYLGEAGVVGGQQGLHQQLEQGVRDADADGAAQHGVGFAEVLHRRHGCHGAAGVGYQRAAEIRKVYVFADAVKQRHPQFLLQLAYLDADRRLGVAQLRRGSGDILQRRRMQERIQVAYLHGERPPFLHRTIDRGKINDIF